MAQWLDKTITEEGAIATCSSCHITQSVKVYEDKITYQYCPYCGAKMVNPNIDNNMTSKELYTKRIVPTRYEISCLERKYDELLHREKAEEAGVKVANCGNCAYSCVLSITDHNECLGGRCTCCNDWCYQWMPDTAVSAWLRQNKHYDDSLVYRLENIFGNDFIKSGDVELIKSGLEWMKEVENKTKQKSK